METLYSLKTYAHDNVYSMLRISALINSILLTLGITVLSVFQAIHFVWCKVRGSQYIVSSAVESNIAQMFALLLLSLLAAYWIKNISSRNRHYAWSIYLILSLWQTLSGVNLTTGIALLVIGLWSFRYVWGQSLSSIAFTTIKNIETAMMEKLDSEGRKEATKNNSPETKDTEWASVDEASEEVNPL